MEEQLVTLRTKALAALGKVSSPRELEEWRVAYLGRKGNLSQILRGLGSLEAADRQVVGALVNELKANLESLLF